MSRHHWEKYSIAYLAMESTILDYYDLNPFLTDQEVVRALKSVRRMYRGEDTHRDYTVLAWTLCHVLRIVILWKKYSDTIIVNCIDRLIQSVENHSWGKKSQNYLDFITFWLGS